MSPRPVGALCHRLSRVTRDGDDGFTLVEVIVAFVIFMVVAGGATFTVLGGLQSSRATHSQVSGTNVAQQEIERARSMPRASLTATPTATTTTVLGSEKYTSTRTISYLPNGASCPTGIATDAPHKIAVTVTVTWPSSKGKTIRMDTVLAC